MAGLPLYVRWARLSGLAALLLALCAVVVVFTGDVDRGRRVIMAALALGGAGLIGSAFIFFHQRAPRDPQDRP